ncbi:MAG: hypothetical protein ABH812_00950 [bacterium]
MKKKTLVWVMVFVLLIGINLIITLKYMSRVNKVNAALVILDEIDQLGLSNYEKTSEGTVAYDIRVSTLKSFFRIHNSPLFDFADHIVQKADEYKFDYRLLPAIAMQESTLCRSIPKNSHNCWGWGIYGNTVTRFDSYDEAIDTISKGLKENYIDHGLITPSQIMAKYTPSSNGSWARAVNLVIGYLE